MNLIFCKFTSLRGAHGVGRGAWAPLGLHFLELSMKAGWRERVMWWIGVAVAIDVFIMKKDFFNTSSVFDIFSKVTMVV